MAALGSSFGPMCAMWESYGGPSGQKEHPEVIQDKFCTHLKNIKIPRVFFGFWETAEFGRDSPREAQKMPLMRRFDCMIDYLKSQILIRAETFLMHLILIHV